MFNLSDVSAVVVALIPLYPFLIALASVLFKHLDALLPAAAQSNLRAVVSECVSAVEQAGEGMPSDAKKTMCLNFVASVCKAEGIPYNADVVGMLIESSVYYINQYKQEPPKVQEAPVTQAPAQA